MSDQHTNNPTTASEPSATTPVAAPATTPLNERRLGELATAYSRYIELSDRLKSTLITPETATLQAEHAGITRFLGNALLAHANELLGCYHIVHSEYQPVLKSIAIIARRIGLIGVPDNNTAAPE
jgi:hypothetical protein